MKVLARRYVPSGAAQWNQFVRESKNGTFLFERAYMDYHADRFNDHSLMFADEHQRLIGIMPANEAGAELVSHGGLTYGGLITGPTMTTPRMLAIFEAMRAYLASAGIRQLRYKTVPRIYHRVPADEDLYALFRADATAYRTDVLSVISTRARLPLQERRRRKIRLAERHHVDVSRSNDFAGFWRMLEANLAAQHGVKPTHTLAEIALLQGRFPDNICLHTCAEGGELLAGIVVYDTPLVAHAQYIASTSRGRDIGAVDLLILHLVEHEYAHRDFFDLGISNEHDGRILNSGLIEQKEGFGARAIAHQFFQMRLGD